ncbi:uncharacterized protein KNAG_0J00740 [Huiozyma naganishii CBS 8797]|uniref:Uncharacterized protein n=1 Tax=Huiozyma naganishii (strain ATCC MYA-139 / BCRC 22969 / CBS 8797 / KCTC 17520 / NBRC 10181 / NCYC 3082 / Yp74L-3) TaxID=1071383 RepID=J7S2P1_HUIN7|nr:hypothetical protein KNAG_0J00740 [Kazachstania naganishii CBS 8797]CCK72157.1 hypothetical protein KNAG_0J00740 [Kazachstania naganishii CBS 8797]
MSDDPVARYVGVIDAIISSADPDEISPKKIRKALQELYGLDLSEHRKQVNDTIIERFNYLQEHPMVLVDKQEFAERVQRRPTAPSKVTKKVSKKKTSKKTKGDGAPKGLAARELVLSEKLAQFLGAARLPRTEVVRGVWDYIKAHELQNPADRREIFCDEAMQPVFGRKMTMFQLNKILSDHLFKPEEVVEGDK